mgnify:CR=1 FL=1|jgi:hypothetical protein|tara:strand:+ start:7386 stop:7799 length:414 start_codon:yes stop_codon:yes gene_type:complete
MTTNRPYLATYYLKTPYENNRRWGGCDYLLSFITTAVEHPEVINERKILDDACRRIPHLYHFLEGLLEPSYNPEVMNGDVSPATITLIDCRDDMPDELSNLPPLDFQLSHYGLTKVYGDEESILDATTMYLPQPHMR